MPSTEELRKNFEDQVAKTDSQILELEKNLEKAKEYRVKLLGGLETLEILDPSAKSEEEVQSEAAETNVESSTEIIE